MARLNCVVSGVGESPFATVRLRTAAAKGFKKVENATAVIWTTPPIVEKTFRRPDAPELLADVASGVVYINGVHAVNRGAKKVRRLISFTHFLTEPRSESSVIWLAHSRRSFRSVESILPGPNPLTSHTHRLRGSDNALQSNHKVELRALKGDDRYGRGPSNLRSSRHCDDEVRNADLERSAVGVEVDRA